MRSTIIKGIDNVNRESWDCIAFGHPYAGWDWCQYGEQVLDALGYYVLVFDDDEKPIGGACFYVYHDDALPIKNSLLHRAVKWYLRHFPMVVARTAYGTNYKGIFLPRDASLQADVMSHILEAGKQITRENHGSFLICDYLEDQDLDYPWQGFIKLRDFMDVGTLLPVECYDNFADYTQDLRKKKGKRPVKDIRRHTRRALDRGITVTFQKELPQPERAIELLEAIDQKYAEVFTRPFTRAIIASASQLKPENALWMTACVEEELIACELIFYDEVTGICTPSLFGRDQSVDFSYFYTFYEVIRYAIETLDARTIIGNAGKEHFKLRLGFEPHYHNHFAVYTPSALNRVIANLLIRVLSQQESDATAGPSASNA